MEPSLKAKLDKIVNDKVNELITENRKNIIKLQNEIWALEKENKQLYTQMGKEADPKEEYDNNTILRKKHLNERIKRLELNRYRFNFSTSVFYSIRCEKARKCPKNKGRLTGSVFDGLDKADWERVPVLI
jgi:hypothetical protein